MAECNAVNQSSSSPMDKIGQMPALFQRLAQCLKDPDKNYEDKVSSILSAWSSLSQSPTCQNMEELTQILYKDTLQLVLRGEWKKLPQANKTHLVVTLNKTASNLTNTPACELCQDVIRLVKDPWNDPRLAKIIHESPADITDAEVCEFCLEEKSVLLSIRLDVLCESRCEDFALNLVAVARRCLALDERFAASCPVERREHWLDLHLALLFRKKDKAECVKILRLLSLEDGHRLVQRLINRDSALAPTRPPVWRNSLKVAELASQCLVTQALTLCPPPTSLSPLAVQLVQLEKVMGKSNQQLTGMLHELVDKNNKITSAHMYILSSALASQYSEELNAFCIELSVRALVVDLNDLEHQKVNAKEEALVKQAERGLATAFSSLADLVAANVRICRECALTAFSLHPTQERLERLTELAALPTGPDALHKERTTGPVGMEAVVGEPPPGSGGGPGGGGGGPLGGCLDLTAIKQEDDASGSQAEDADSGVELSGGSPAALAPALTGNRSGSPVAPSGGEEEAGLPYSREAADSLGVSESVIKDLAVVVHSQRWEVLSWRKGWEELEPLCIRYVSDQEKMRSVTKELRFLKVDYSQFKDMPRPERDEFWGIEKGYENCIELDDDEDDHHVEGVAGGHQSRVSGTAGAGSGSMKKKKSLKRSSRPDSESSEPDCPELEDGPLLSVERKKVLRKKWLHSVMRSMKTSSDSDSGRSIPGSSKGLNRSRSKSSKLLVAPKSGKTVLAEGGVKRTNRARASKRSRRGGSAANVSLTDALRGIRPDFGVASTWPSPSLSPDLTTRSSSMPHLYQGHPELSCGDKDRLPDAPLEDEHFAPMLSTLDMQPKVVLKRTPVNSPDPSPIKRPVSSSPPKRRAAGSLKCKSEKNLLAEAEKLLLRPCVILEKLVYPERRPCEPLAALASYKGLDHLEVRPPATAVHMVQLPNPPVANSSHGATANGLPGSTASDLGGHQPQQLPQEHQDEAGKAATASASSAQSNAATAAADSTTPTAPPTTTVVSTITANALEIINSVASASSSGLSETQSHNNPAVTLVSTPSVSIFQVAHRPSSSTGTGSQTPAGVHLQLQPVSAVTGFINPVSPRNARLPNASSPVRPRAGTSGRNPPARPAGSAEAGSSPSNSNNITLAQLLAQSPAAAADSTAVATASTESPPSSQNGPRQGGYGRAARPPRRNNRDEPSGGESNQLAGVTPLAGSGESSAASRVPLVKYVDLDAVSSPTRARPTPGGSGTAMRRASQGSNSNSPDPHRAAGTSAAKSAGQRASAAGHNNPSSPAMVNSPQSPALHPAPPSPLSFRSKQPQHNAFSGGKDRLTSPSHPSQCPSPFSRPSSRSQDASPSPSDSLGNAMYPPGLVPFSSGVEAAGSSLPASGGPGRFSGGSSPNSVGSSGSLSAGLPKFGMAFAKRSHFDVMPILSPPTAGAGPATGNVSLAATAQVNATGNSNNNGFAESSRRFASTDNPHHHHSSSSGGGGGSTTTTNPPAEEEGLGSKLQSLLESALNGQINRSPNRAVQQHLQQAQQQQQQQQQQLVVTGNPEMLLSDSAAQHPMGSVGRSVLLMEELREFESVYERVASTSNSGQGHHAGNPAGDLAPWTDLAVHPDDASPYMGVVSSEFAAPLSSFSESMDVSANPSPAPSLSGAGGTGDAPDGRPPSTLSTSSSSRANDPSSAASAESASAPLMQQLLTVASAARQALAQEEEEKGGEVDESPETVASVVGIQEESVDAGAIEPTRVVVLPAVVVVSTNAGPEPIQPVPLSSSSSSSNGSHGTGIVSQAIAQPTTPKPAASRSKAGSNNNKSSPVVSPGGIGKAGSTTAASTGSAATTPGAAASSSATSSATKAPQKAHDDEHTVLRVQAILEEYKEQLRNSPDLQNKPAPRRRSNPLPSPSTTPKRRKSGQSKVKLLSQHARAAVVAAASVANSSAASSISAADGGSAGTEGTAVGGASAESVTVVNNAPGSLDAPTPADLDMKVESASGETKPPPEGLQARGPGPTQSPATASVQVLNAPQLQLSIPVSAVVTTSRAAGDALPVTSSVMGTTLTVTSTSSAGLTGISAVPVHMIQQQVLVASGPGGATGVRQYLVPLTFGTGGRTVNVGGPRPLIVRNVTIGQPGTTHQIINIRPGQYAMRAVATSSVATAVPAAPVSTTTTVAGQPTVTLTEATKPVLVIPAEIANSVPNPSSVSSTSAVSWTSDPTAGNEDLVAPGSATDNTRSPGNAEAAVPTITMPTITTQAGSITTGSATGVLRYIPTVNRVNLPLPSGGLEPAPLPAVASSASSPPSAQPSQTPPPAVGTTPLLPAENHPDTYSVSDSSPAPVTVVDDGVPPDDRNSPLLGADRSLTPSAPTTDADKLLNADAEAGVSEFLPCADFMGPGVSPSPCFSLSDSPLGSQNSTPISSPATFQASSADDDSVGLTSSPGCVGTEGSRKKGGRSGRAGAGRTPKTRLSSDNAKLLKHSSTRRTVMVLSDHGGTTFRRMGDNDPGPTVVRSDRRPLGKRLASKKAAEAAAAAAASAGLRGSSPSAHSATPSPRDEDSGMRDGSPCSSPVSSSPSHIAEANQPLSATLSPATNRTRQQSLRTSLTSNEESGGTNSSPPVLVYGRASGNSTLTRSTSRSTGLGEGATVGGSAPVVVPKREAASPIQTTPVVVLKMESMEEALKVKEEEDESSETTGEKPTDSEDRFIVRPRRCGRLQNQKDQKQEQQQGQHDPVSCPLGSKPNRRSSVRTNVKKTNCPCCVDGGTGGGHQQQQQQEGRQRKRAKSDSAAAAETLTPGVHQQLELVSSPSKKLLTSGQGTASNSSPSSPPRDSAPTTGQPLKAKPTSVTTTKKYAQRKR